MKEAGMKRLGRRGVAAAFVVVVAVALGGIAYASIPDANGVIHGCYRKTTGELIVIDSGGKGCEEGWKPLNWSQTGPTGLTGPTGPTGATGATGPTGPTGALSSAYLDAFTTVPRPFVPGAAVWFDVAPTASGIVTILPGGDFTALASGVYQVTVDLQDGSDITAQLSLNGVGVGPSVLLNCANTTCTFTRLLTVPAPAIPAIIRLVNTGVGIGIVGIGSGITIVRIA
jgi:hypothetical protein